MRFRILGRVRVAGAGRLQPRDQRMLAVLLLTPNALVTRGQLIDALWPEGPPSTAGRQVLNSVSRMRRLLGTETLQAERVGYRIAVADGELDAQVFTQLVDQASALRADGHPIAAAQRLREAMGLWHGPALAGLPGRYLEAAASRLEELRLDAFESCLDLELDQRTDASLIGELTEFVNAHPLRERCVGVLMTALWRMGRQADALARYRELARRLAEELGIDPSAPLQRLHAAILRGEIDTPTDADAGVLPRQLPAAVRPFVGRQAELHQLDLLLADRPGNSPIIATIDGLAGVGKTTLAVHWAHLVAPSFPDGQLYLNLHGFSPDGVATQPATAIRSLLDALGVIPQRIPQGLDAQTALYRSVLSGRQVLVVLDNAYDAEQVRPLLPATAECMVVVTSRRSLTGLSASHGAHMITLGPMPASESTGMLNARLGHDRVSRARAAAEKIIEWCAGLPLALALAASRAASRPHASLASLATEMRDGYARLDSLRTADRAMDIRAVFSWSQRHLSTDSERLFRLLGLHPGPDVSVAAAASLVGVPSAEVRPMLMELADAHLVSEPQPGRYTLHDLLRAYAAEQVRDVEPAQRHAATRRLLDHYLCHAQAADELINPTRQGRPRAMGTPALGDRAGALRWLATEHHCLLAMQELATTTGWDTHAWQLGVSLGYYLSSRNYWQQHLSSATAAAAAAQRSGHDAGQTLAHINAARALLQLCDFDPAEERLRTAIKLAKDTGDAYGLAEGWHILSWVLDLKEHRDEAIQHARLAFELFRSSGNVCGEARTLNTMGWLHAKRGDHELALDLCRSALRLHEEIGYTEGQASAWHSLGYAHHHLGNQHQALRCFHHALRIYRDSGSRYFEGVTLADAGDAHRALGDHAAAVAAWRGSLVIFAELDHPAAEPVRLKLIAAFAEAHPRRLEVHIGD